MTDPSDYKVTAFERAGVWISAPPDVNVSLDDTSASEQMKVAQPDFQLIRVLGNLSFSSTGNPNRPAHLQVIFTSDDSAQAARIGRPLKVAKWDGTRWVPFPQGTTRVQGSSVPAGGGIGLLDIPRLDDPPIGAGA